MISPRTVVPPIKCQGIKTKLVPWIKAITPSNIKGRWIEPFMGSGVVAFNMRPRHAILSDSNPHLIRFYQAVNSGEITSGRVREFLQKEGKLLLESEGEYYYDVRTRFNELADPIDFLFLNRACFNGMIRFNRKGGFNVPFCRKPNRFAQAYVTKICNQVQAVSDICEMNDFQFIHRGYTETIAEATGDDFIYCDPPYIGRHADYFNGWDETHEEGLAEALGKIDGKFILSTWHSNDYRSNKYIDKLWSNYNLLTREHFYHIGGSEKNRNPMLEALITNFKTHSNESPVANMEQMILLEKAVKYNSTSKTKK